MQVDSPLLNTDQNQVVSPAGRTIGLVVSVKTLQAHNWMHKTVKKTKIGKSY